MDFVEHCKRLRRRAQLLARARQFFDARDVVEMDVPQIHPSAIDTHIEPIPVTYAGSQQYHLHCSPELALKRLLCMGMGDCYYLGHVFRDGEKGQRHSPEFTMAEWYRCGFSFEQMIDETIAFCELFIGPQRRELLSYPEMFHKYSGLDLATCTEADLLACLAQIDIQPFEGWELEGVSALIDIVFGVLVEPHLGQGALSILVDWPLDRAELARMRDVDGRCVAERFELYFGGYELANGYGELGDAAEHRRRFEEKNQRRVHLGKGVLPMSKGFFEGLEQGLPPCCGVAVGFDRLAMLEMGRDDIADVIPFKFAE